MTHATLFAFGIGPWEAFLAFMVVMILFGARKVPEMAKGLGQGIKEFKKATKEEPEAPKLEADKHVQRASEIEGESKDS